MLSNEALAILNKWAKKYGGSGGGTGAVSSVNTKVGAVVLTTSDIAEGTNLYYTDTRVSANTDVVTAKNHTSNTSNPHGVTKAQVGLGNVTNDAQVKRTEMGIASGVATLDSSGLVPVSQLPASATSGISSINSKTGSSVTLTTTDISEGTNQYYTDARVDARILLQKAVNSGLATLDASGKVPVSQMPISTVNIVSVANQTARLALPTSTNLTLALQADTQIEWALNANASPSVAGNWINCGSYASMVASVNGATGAVTVDKTTVGLGNVTNDKQVKAIATSVVGDLITWNSTAGDIVNDSGISAASVVTLNGTQTLTNKTLSDSTTIIANTTDSTKKIKFDTSGITTATTRTYTMPNKNGTLSIVPTTANLTTLSNITLAENVIYEITNVAVANSVLTLPTGTATGNFIQILAACSGFNDSTTFSVSGNINGGANVVVNNRSFCEYRFVWSQATQTWILSIGSTGY